MALLRAEGNILNKMIELGAEEMGKKVIDLVGNNRIGKFLMNLFQKNK